MHGMNNAKVINPQEARTINHCKKIEKKYLKLTQQCYSKKKCRFKYITSQYIHIKVNGNDPLSMHTKNEQSNIELTKSWLIESVYEMLQHPFRKMPTSESMH
jgi:hypothetical protein